MTRIHFNLLIIGGFALWWSLNALARNITMLIIERRQSRG